MAAQAGLQAARVMELGAVAMRFHNHATGPGVTGNPTMIDLVKAGMTLEAFEALDFDDDVAVFEEVFRQVTRFTPAHPTHL